MCPSHHPPAHSHSYRISCLKWFSSDAQRLLWCHLVAIALETLSSHASVTGGEDADSHFLWILLKLDRCPEVGMGASQTFSETQWNIKSSFEVPTRAEDWTEECSAQLANRVFLWGWAQVRTWQEKPVEFRPTDGFSRDSRPLAPTLSRTKYNWHYRLQSLLHIGITHKYVRNINYRAFLAMRASLRYWTSLRLQRYKMAETGKPAQIFCLWMLHLPLFTVP